MPNLAKPKEESDEMKNLPGLAIAIIAVAVVLPFNPNHSSEYFGPTIWNHGCAMPAPTWPIMRRA